MKTINAFFITRLQLGRDPEPLPAFGAYFTEASCNAAIIQHQSYGAVKTSASASYLARRFSLVPTD